MRFLGPLTALSIFMIICVALYWAQYLCQKFLTKDPNWDFPSKVFAGFLSIRWSLVVITAYLTYILPESGILLVLASVPWFLFIGILSFIFKIPQDLLNPQFLNPFLGIILIVVFTIVCDLLFLRITRIPSRFRQK